MKAIGFNSGNQSCKRQTRNFLSPLRTDGGSYYPHNEGVCKNLLNDDGTMGSGC